MPLASAWPLRSVAIGAGVGGKVSHRSAATAGRAVRARNAARTNWRMARSCERCIVIVILIWLRSASTPAWSRRSAAAAIATQAMYIFLAMSNPFFTIGHSTRPAQEFVALLKAADIKLVVDVRTVPRSRTNPQFNRDVLPAALAAHGIAYEHFGRTRGTSRKAAWRIARGQRFLGERKLSQLRRLRAEAKNFAQALKNCARSVTRRCRPSCARKASGGDAIAASSPIISSPRATRSSISSGPGHLEQARLTPEARVEPDGTLAYPKDSQLMLDLGS